MDRDDAIDWGLIAAKKYVQTPERNMAGKSAYQIINDWCEKNNAFDMWECRRLLFELEASGFEIRLK